MMNTQLVLEAYKKGSSRGTSLAHGYKVSADEQSVFCANRFSCGGVMVGKDEGYYNECPEGFKTFDMSAALAVAEGCS